MLPSTHYLLLATLAVAAVVVAGCRGASPGASAQPSPSEGQATTEASGPAGPDRASTAGDAPLHDATLASAFAEEHGDFGSYWYQGLAELNRYELRQARYGEQHDGEAVLIFVTEDFLEDKQVKYEHGDRSSAVSILKLNAYRRFYTGIYPYSIMTSVFSPVETPTSPALKLTNTTQEWCGHVYTQLNLREGGDALRYDGRFHSYFQDEADQEFSVEGATLEDELWTIARRDPQALPTGEVRLFPAAHWLRMKHRDVAPRGATATMTRVNTSPFGDEPALRYVVDYADAPRQLTLFIEPAFPHRIVAWQETGRSFDGEELTTEAVLTRSIMLDYWTRNGTEDSVYRDVLGLEY